MVLYRVLLVDDEDEIRSGIITKIDWKSNGFELVGDTNNGVDALEMAETLHPDVVLTDIKMPFMDGLELCKCLIKRFPSCKLVVFSGFDDFEYAHQAIKMNVFEYILKPISARELTSVLQKLKRQIDCEIEEKRDIESLRSYYQESLPVMRDQFLARLIEGRVSLDKLVKYARQYGLEYPPSYWAVAIFRPEYPIKGSSSLSNSIDLVPISAKRIIDYNLEQSFDIKTFLYDDDVISIVRLDNKEQILNLVCIANLTCKEVKRILEFTLSSGIGLVSDDILELKYSYQGALNAVDYRVLVGSGRAIYVGDVELGLSTQLDFNEQDERELHGAIKFGTPDNIRAVIEKLMKRIHDSRLPLAQYQIFLMEIQTTLIKLARAYNLDVDDILNMRDRGYVQFTDFTSLSEMGNWFSEVCVRISLIIGLKRTDSTKLIAIRAKKFINENYADNGLSVETLCKHLHLSSAYFSTLFKRETGGTFINYLTSIRMEKAAWLLRSTDDKTYLISQNTGFIDPNYFSYVFKRYFGISPSKFRAGEELNKIDILNICR
ncbi:MAG: response regulator [Ruminiclostridium sp.]